MEQITYQQVLADIYDENSKDLLVHHNEYEETIPPEDKHPDELENQEEFQKPIGSHASNAYSANPTNHEDKTKLSVLYDKQTQTRIINIDSRFRDNYTTSPSSNFLFRSPYTIKNVISVRMSSIELPNSFYSFSSYNPITNVGRGNTTFYVTYPAASYTTPGTKILITIPNGNWDASTIDSSAVVVGGQSTSILNIVASQMNSQVNSHLPSGFTTQPNFVLTLNAASGLATIGNTSSIPFDIDFTPQTFTNQSRTTDYGLGYNLGFRQLQYSNKTSYTATGILNTIDSNYVFITLDPDWKVIINETPDRTQLHSFAKVVVNVPKFSVVFDNGSNTLTKEFFLKQPTNITSIPVRLSDPYDQDLDLNGLDFSFSLEVKEVLDSALYEAMRS